jgi:hypothetical protein
MYRRARLGMIWAVSAACLAAPVAAGAASAASQYLYERTLMGAADARCHLFSPDIGRALAAARVQARNTALRAGDGSAAVAATERRALDKAASVDCRAPGLKLAADRLRSAFADYAKLQVLTFPGVRANWRAERPYPGYHGAPRWGLAQSVVGQGGWMVFGITGGQVTLLDARRDSAPAPIARIVFRNPAILSEPYVDLRRSDPADQVAPAAVSQAFIARGRAVAARSLLPAGAKTGLAYQFPPDVTPALARLDPREMAAVQLVYPGAKGDRVVTGWVEVGDLAAAQAFLATR